MKNKKNSRYKKVKNTILAGASTGILAGMLLLGGNNAFAETMDQVQSESISKMPSGMHMMHRWNSNTKAGSLAKELGLNSEEVKQELKSGKALKQILQDHGIVPDQIQKAFSRIKQPLQASSGRMTKHYKKSS